MIGSIFSKKWVEKFRSSAPVVAPTVQKFLASGGGTYITPANVSYIRVRMVGGGGGGQASNSTGGGGGPNGLAGGTTTFGSFLSCEGGQMGVYGSSARGGIASLSLPAIGLSVNGGRGQGGILQSSVSINMYNVGGMGGSSFLGGSSGSAIASGGFSAPPNSGGGGSGGGTDNTPHNDAGGGAGAGSYIDAIITNPNSSYSFNVGEAGIGGADADAGGANSYAGGAGGSGMIIVEEYYK